MDGMLRAVIVISIVTVSILYTTSAQGLRCVPEAGLPNSCQNGGRCVELPPTGLPTCICKGGASGKFCQIEEAVTCSFKGETIQAEERLVVDDCITCYCNGNRTRCDIVACDATDCENPVKIKGECCEICLPPELRCVAGAGLPTSCRNGGVCLELTPGLPTCICKRGSSGKLCQIAVNECESEPCLNGGSCADEPIGFVCSCAEGWQGTRCEEEAVTCSFKGETIQAEERLVVDDCITCYCNGNRTRCDIKSCPATDCENPVKIEGECCKTCNPPGPGCATEPGRLNSCLNGGQCRELLLPGLPTCICKRGSRGRFCQIDVNQCETNPCSNGGSCVDERNFYVCSCAEGWQGPNCEEPGCLSDQSECDDGECIHSDYYCDGTPHCSDGSDELTCCPFTQFNCANGNCLNYIQRCDGTDDCMDNSDEDDCVVCEEDEYRCQTNICIPSSYLCDYFNDCGDNQDEMEGCVCELELDVEFDCDSGGCIKGTWFCDGEPDCFDGSDESPAYCECPPDTWQCLDEQLCAPFERLCDGIEQCFDGSDELYCPTESPCPVNETACANGDCIPSEWYCDTTPDCTDGSDELTCCPDTQFNCANGRCIEWGQWCDKNNDCRDNSDEERCVECADDEYMCRRNICIPESLTCDYINDCGDNSDEYVDCECDLDNEFECDSGGCINGTWLCDRESDCFDGSDESVAHCGCPTDTWQCLDRSLCAPLEDLCDGKPICLDGSDEFDCTTGPECADKPGLPNSCLNGGECRELLMPGLLTCICKRGTSGEFCQIAVNECESNPCLNGGSCADEPIGFVCSCAEGWQGTNCEESPCPVNKTVCANGECIPSEWYCDTYPDCADESDELTCCPDTHFNCGNGRCIEWDQWCDKNNDCRDNSDEESCVECADDEYMCRSNICIPESLRCDYIDDCGDNSDEYVDCVCELELDVEFDCDSGGCINGTWLCDGEEDCFDGSDESVAYCDCPPDTWQCLDELLCAPFEYLCDGNPDCLDGSDEFNCNTESPCPVNETVCANGECIPSEWYCDTTPDCTDESDELTCCPDTQFNCVNGRCIEWDQWCDKNNDCRDNSDEESCVECADDEYMCRSNICIPENLRCDYFNDCGDNSDEYVDCVCELELDVEFDCDSGGCINGTWLCDGEEDCFDGSDESVAYCDCPPDTWQCLDELLCAPFEYLCDGNPDCLDGSDEFNCTTESPCPEDETVCADGECIPSIWFCDNYADCSDSSDELTCCPDTQFNCANGRCLEWDQWCDKTDDCRDNSDEDQCVECAADEFMCRNNICVPDSYRCDYMNDCGDNSDEYLDCVCELENDFEFDCDSGGCINGTWLCDGDLDCFDGSDESEAYCECPPDTWQCLDELLCAPFEYLCDGDSDCLDGSDEFNCTTESICEQDEHVCDDGVSCILADWVCDGIGDCPGDTDETEEFCSMCPYKFLCTSGRCVFLDDICDGRDRCGDNSDEDQICVELPSASIVDESSDSITLTWAEPPPVLTSDLPRSITQYAVTVTPNSGQSQTTYFPAEAGTDFTIRNLEQETTYDIQISAVIDTEGQGEGTFDLGADSLSATTETSLCPKSDQFYCEENVYDVSDLCLPKEWVCDKVPDCKDSSDELLPECCESDEFLCATLRCVSLDAVCDGSNDCGDMSDEEACDTPNE